MLVIVSLANVPILDPRSRTTMAKLKDIVRTTFRVRVKRRLDSSGAVPEVWRGDWARVVAACKPSSLVARKAAI